MSQWDERIQTHPVWQRLDALGPALDQAMGKEDVQVVALEDLARAKAVLTFAGKRLAGAEKQLLTSGPLDNISAHLQSATNELQAFVSSGNGTHIANANAYMDSVLTQVAQLNLPLSPHDVASLLSAAEGYRSVMEGSVRSVESAAAQTKATIEGLRTKADELTAAVGTERQNLSNLLSQQQSQFSAAQEQRSQKFADTEAAHEKRLDEGSAALAAFLNAAKTDHEKKLLELSEGFGQKAQGLVEAIEERKRRVEKLVGIIGNEGVTAGYQKAAGEARFTVRVWQAITLAAMAFISIVAYKAFLPVVTGAFTWPGFAGKAFLCLTVGVLAAYGAKQADKYQDNERRNRKLALELEAVGPFIEPLSPEKQEAFRMFLAERSFGNDPISRFGSDASPATVLDMFKSKEFKDLIHDLAEIARMFKK